MTGRDVWISILAVLVYSGPFLPMVVTPFVPNAPRGRRLQNVRRLLLLSCLQAVTLVPFIYALVMHEPDAEHALYLPFFTGIPMFLGALVYAASEFGHARRNRQVPNDA